MKEKERKARPAEIVNVAGRVVYVRHATAWDLDTIRRDGRGGWQELDNLDPERVVVAAEEDSIIGFGIVGRPSADGTICVTLFERKDRKKTGSSIVRHVLENAPLIKALRASADLPDRSVRMVVSRRKRGSAKQGLPACPVPARALLRTAGPKRRH